MNKQCWAPIRQRFAPLANVNLGRTGFVETAPFSLISLVLTQFEEMAIGNTRQALKTDIAMQLKSPFAQLARGGARDGAVQGICIG